MYLSFIIKNFYRSLVTCMLLQDFYLITLRAAFGIFSESNEMLQQLKHLTNTYIHMYIHIQYIFIFICIYKYKVKYIQMCT